MQRGSVRGEGVFVLRPAETSKKEKSWGSRELPKGTGLLGDGWFGGLSGGYFVVCTVEAQIEKRVDEIW